MRNATHAAALQAFGRKKSKSQDWFKANIAILQPIIKEKRDALQNYQHTPSKRYPKALRQARSRAEEECKNCANNYWMSLCAEIQLFADAGNIGSLFEGIKKAIGVTQSKCAPLKTSTGETIIDKSKPRRDQSHRRRETPPS